MRLLKRLFAPKPRSQAHIVKRAGQVIDRVIFDVGIDTLVYGTFVLDKRWRLKFIGVPLVRRRGVVAAVQVSAIAESDPLRVLSDGPIDLAAVQGHCATLAQAVVRELGHQLPELRALPPSETTSLPGRA